MSTWWDDNEAPQGPQGDPFADAVNALYRQYYHTDAPADAIQAHRGNPGGLPAIEKMLKDTAPVAAAAPAPTAPAGGNDARQFVLDAFAAKGIAPRDEADLQYWIGKVGDISDPGNRAYWQGHMAQSQGGVGDYQERPEARAAGSADYTTPPADYVSNPNAPAVPNAQTQMAAYAPPTWSGGPAPTATPLTPYKAPTLEELKASPGYQARLDAGQLALDRSAAARGSVLSGGTQKATSRYGQDYASNEYANLFGQGLQVNQNNNAATQTGNQNAYATYLANYGQFSDAANRDLTGRQQNVSENNTAFNQGQTGYQNRYAQYLDANSRTLSDYITNTTTKRNQRLDYWSQLKDLYGGGLNAATGSYKPGIGTV